MSEKRLVQGVVVDDTVNNKTKIYYDEKSILENLTPEERSLWAVWTAIAAIDGNKQHLIYRTKNRCLSFIQDEKDIIEVVY